MSRWFAVVMGTAERDDTGPCHAEAKRPSGSRDGFASGRDVLQTVQESS